MSDADGADWPPLPKARRHKPLPVVNVGDRIKVTDEGVVTRKTELPKGGYRLTVLRDNGMSSFVVVRAGMTAKVEVIDPEFEDGGIYQAADGQVWRYTAQKNSLWSDDAGWERFGTAGHFSLGTPKRPLTKLR